MRVSEVERRLSGSFRLRLLGEKVRVDVRQDAAAGDGDGAQELVQLLVVADGELDVVLSRAAEMSAITQGSI